VHRAARSTPHHPPAPQYIRRSPSFFVRAVSKWLSAPRAQAVGLAQRWAVRGATLPPARLLPPRPNPARTLAETATASLHQLGLLRFLGQLLLQPPLLLAQCVDPVTVLARHGRKRSTTVRIRRNFASCTAVMLALPNVSAGRGAGCGWPGIVAGQATSVVFSRSRQYRQRRADAWSVCALITATSRDGL